MDDKRIDEIDTQSIRLPQYYGSDMGESIEHALYLNQLHGNDVNSMPTHLELIRENANGTIATATYVLKESHKFMKF